MFSLIFFRCGDHTSLFNLFDVTLKNLGIFNVNLFCDLYSFFARFYAIVEFSKLRNKKRNKSPTTTVITNLPIFINVCNLVTRLRY